MVQKSHFGPQTSVPVPVASIQKHFKMHIINDLLFLIEPCFFGFISLYQPVENLSLRTGGRWPPY